MKWTVAVTALIAGTACGSTNSTPIEEEPSKADIAARSADDGTDWCERYGWYDDGECDEFCPRVDPDCAEPVPYEPCGGLSCGDTCTICAPDDDDCFETAVVKYCDGDGGCAPSTPACDEQPAPYEPCGGLSCGDSCTICDPADPDCIETAVEKQCNADGGCEPGLATCETDPDPSYEPCGGLTCGDSCTICDPADPDCIETAVEKQCNADGVCAPGLASCETDPCDGLSCGDLCTTCDPNDRDCDPSMRMYCDANGACGMLYPLCDDEPYDPCAGSTCGDSCQQCPPNDPTCVETAVEKQCNAAGACVPAQVLCPAEQYIPCAGLTCGDSCQQCPPNDPNCVETAVLKFCHADGACAPTVPQCATYDPCDGLSCGASCQQCPPNDPHCVETAVQKYCNANGACTPTMPLCAAEPYSPCERLQCGDRCQLCPPNDPTCVEPAVLRVCNDAGACVIDSPGAAACSM